MKFKNKQTGAILEPKNEMVLNQLRKSEDYTPYDGQDAAQDGPKPLSKMMNKGELLAAAQAAGIDVPDGATKDDIIELIQANSGNQ